MSEANLFHIFFTSGGPRIIMEHDRTLRRENETKTKARRNFMISFTRLVATHDPNSQRDAIGGVNLMNTK